MKINIGNHDFTELWDGVLYKALSDYPKVSDNEMKDIIDFAAYEKANGRECEVTADRKEILDYVKKEMKNPQKYINARRPAIIRECTACEARGGCMTDYVYAVIIPESYKKELEVLVPENIKDRTFYLNHENLDVWQ